MGVANTLVRYAVIYLSCSACVIMQISPLETYSLIMEENTGDMMLSLKHKKDNGGSKSSIYDVSVPTHF